MCGIAGIISVKQQAEVHTLRKMTDAIWHRGPDGEGQWVNGAATVALGHRRLSILDTSDCGSQPMHYASRYSIVFNGEVYNYLEIKDRLLKKGYAFRGTSDTEVLLALYHDKKEKCLQEIDGMFAFAIYDNVDETIFLARDRFGEKPLFYSLTEDGQLLFASEMKAIWAGGVPKQVNHYMLYQYLSKNLLENPANKAETFYRNIYRFPAAHYAVFSTKGRIEVQPKRYWDIAAGQQNKAISETDAALRFQELMQTSIKRRLRSDVPLGSSLSGGLDSSLIVCLIDGLDKEKNIVRKTFSAQFPGFEKDESYYQKLVIDQCQVEPHFVFPTAESMLSNLDKIAYHQEEPFGSASICIQYEVFGLAKENNVTVLLDGQGADEILAGYHSYYKPYFNGLKKSNPGEYKRQWQQYQALHADNTINQQHRRSWKHLVKALVPERIQQTVLQKKRDSYSGAAFLSQEFAATYNSGTLVPDTHASLNKALYHETMNYGLEFLLRYADRNSMAHSREVRLPFLYHELVEFLFTLPDHFKINDGWTKWIMRHSFEQTIPAEIAWRKDKIGYEPPQQKWMMQPAIKEEIQHSLQELVQDKILSPQVLENTAGNVLQWKAFVVSKTLLSKP